jgi:hypothetical protein
MLYPLLPQAAYPAAQVVYQNADFCSKIGTKSPAADFLCGPRKSTNGHFS